MRIVKCVRGANTGECETQSGKFSVVDSGGRDLHAFHIPAEAIVEVTLGIRATADDLTSLKGLRPDLAYSKARMNAGRYAVDVHPA